MGQGEEKITPNLSKNDAVEQDLIAAGMFIPVKSPVFRPAKSPVFRPAKSPVFRPTKSPVFTSETAVF